MENGIFVTDLEAKQQKIIVAVFLLLGKAFHLLDQKQRAKVTCLESEIAEAWQKKESPVGVISEMPPAIDSPIDEYQQWGGERRYSVIYRKLQLTNVAKGFASVPMPKADPCEKEKPDKSRVFTLQ